MLKKLIRGFRDRAIERLPSRIFLARTVVPALAADQPGHITFQQQFGLKIQRGKGLVQ